MNIRYIALLRGINVGTKPRIDMKSLRKIFETLGYTEVNTYINSGNVIFNSADSPSAIHQALSTKLVKEIGTNIPLLIKTQKEMKLIADAIPEGWQNDKEQKTDVAYLFEEIDKESIINELPIDRDFVDTRYVKGALLWNVKREYLNKSRLNKIAGHKLYKLMTVRNVNTARKLACL